MPSPLRGEDGSPFGSPLAQVHEQVPKLHFIITVCPCHAEPGAGLVPRNGAQRFAAGRGGTFTATLGREDGAAAQVRATSGCMGAAERPLDITDYFGRCCIVLRNAVHTCQPSCLRWHGGCCRWCRNLRQAGDHAAQRLSREPGTLRYSTRMRPCPPTHS